MVADAGKEQFETLPDKEKRFLQLFIWAGCGCHKDLNTVWEGYVAMSEHWKELDVKRHIVLANKDNDPIVKEHTKAKEKGTEPTPAQERAFYQSMRGAIKTMGRSGRIRMLW